MPALLLGSRLTGYTSPDVLHQRLIEPLDIRSTITMRGTNDAFILVFSSLPVRACEILFFRSYGDFSRFYQLLLRALILTTQYRRRAPTVFHLSNMFPGLFAIPLHLFSTRHCSGVLSSTTCTDCPSQSAAYIHCTEAAILLQQLFVARNVSSDFKTFLMRCFSRLFVSAVISIIYTSNKDGI